LVVLVLFFTIIVHLIVVIIHTVVVHELLLSLAGDAHLLVLPVVLVVIFFSVIFLVFAVVHFHVGMQLIDNLWFVIGSLERLLRLTVVYFLTIILVLVVIIFTIILFFILTHLVLNGLLLLHCKPLLLLLLSNVDVIIIIIIHAILVNELLFVFTTNSFVMFTWLVSLLLIDLHELVWLLLLLEHQELLLLLFIQDVHASIFTSCCWDTAREVGQLVQLVKVLSSLKQDLLVFRQMLVWVVVCVSQNGNVLLQISDLVVQIDEFLCLLFHE
jgi:hypothetical protein